MYVYAFLRVNIGIILIMYMYIYMYRTQSSPIAVPFTNSTSRWRQHGDGLSRDNEISTTPSLSLILYDGSSKFTVISI